MKRAAMNPNNLETVILLLLFFLPGYLYFSLKAKFKYQGWDNKEIVFLGFLFSSIIFQFLAWLILRIIKQDILAILKNKDTLNNLLINNLGLIGLQVATALALVTVTAVLTSTKQLKRFALWIQRKTALNKFLELSLEYTPTIAGALEHETDFGRKMVGCVIQMKNGVFYDGNIRHIGHGKNAGDYIIVLSRVTKLSKGVKTKLPDDIKVLVPYDNIESITYKEYPLPENNKEGFVVWSTLNVFFVLILVLLLILLALQGQTTNSDILKLVTELSGAFVVTFLGVYVSVSYSKKQEREKEERDAQKVYVSSLKLLASELSFNEQTLSQLVEGFATMPRTASRYYDQYGMLLQNARKVKTDVFYSLISSGAMEEISKSDKILNDSQLALYNMIDAINGFKTSRNVFKDYYNKTNIPPNIVAIADGLVDKEYKKIVRALGMVASAKEEIVSELGEYGVTFTEEHLKEKNPFIEKLKISIVDLQKLQKVLLIKNPTYLFLNPVFGNVIASMVDLLAYFERKNPYYTDFDETFFNNRQAAMHRAFFTDLHVATEEGLRSIIDKNNFKVVINKQKLAEKIVKNIKQSLMNTKNIDKELEKINDLGGNFVTFNDYLNTVLENIPLDKQYKLACRAYFDALNIIRNKVSHSDMSLSEKEKDKLIKAKFKNAISPKGELQMTFEGYKLLLIDIIKFFDTLESTIK